MTDCWHKVRRAFLVKVHYVSLGIGALSDVIAQNVWKNVTNIGYGVSPQQSE